MENIVKNITILQWNGILYRICKQLLTTCAMVALLAFSACGTSATDTPVDTDADGIADDIDNCPNDPNPEQVNSDKADDGGDACDPDDDNDEVLDGIDNCQYVPNQNQRNLDTDDDGDLCDSDVDGDGIDNKEDSDDDGDGIEDTNPSGDPLDNCQYVPNQNQRNLDTDEDGDLCDSDVDGDGIDNKEDSDDDGDGIEDTNPSGDPLDNCQYVPNAPDNQGDPQDNLDGDDYGDACDDDIDDDGIFDTNLPDGQTLRDNCPFVSNAPQVNLDSDDYGNACDVDDDGNGLIEIFDSTMLDNIRNDLEGKSYVSNSGDEGDDTGCGGNNNITECNGYELMDHIDLLSGDWTPIPENFRATLDGNNNEIRNLTISSNSSNVGFFSILSGTVRNLQFVGGSVTGVIDSNIDRRNIGTLAGTLNLGMIDNVSSNLEVTGSDNSENIGGLVGDSKSSTIQYSYATGDVNSGDGSNRVGGLVGVSRIREGANPVQGTIQYSYATGTVNGGAENDSVGGLVGLSGITTIIQYSYATVGTVNGGAGDDNVGGLVGFSQGSATIQYSYATVGTVNGGAGSDKVGGLVGFSLNSTTSIQYSYATGSVNGGDGDDDVGGLVGEHSIKTNMILNSYSTGETNGGAGDDNVGGLVGEHRIGATINNCYARGNSNGGDGDDTVGGLVGYSLSDFTARFGPNKIINSYATGNVDGGLGSNQANAFVGRENMENITEITSSYYNSDASILNQGTSNTIGPGRTFKQLQLASEVLSTGPFTNEMECEDVAAGTWDSVTGMCNDLHHYDGWSTNDWDFGGSDQLPSLRSNQADFNGIYLLLCGQTAPQVPTPVDPANPDRCPTP